MSANTQALDLNPENGTEIDISLGFSGHEYLLDYGNNQFVTDIDTIEFRINEHYGKRWQTGLVLRYHRLTQLGNPITVGARLSGEGLGVAVKYSFFHSQHLQLSSHIDYVYNQFEASSDTQELVIDWNEWSVGLRANFSITEQVSIYTAADRFRLNGTETLENSGNIDSTSNFDLDSSEENRQWLGLDIHLIDKGLIGFEANEQNTWHLYFQRTF